MKNKPFLLFLKKLKDILLRKKLTPAENRERIVKNISRKGAKDCFTGDDTLSIRGRQELARKDIDKQARSIIKQAIDKPEILFNFVESKGTVIIKSRYMERILKFFGEETGFIPPMTGVRALLFTVISGMFCSVKLDTGFKTPAMFALKDEPVNIYNLSHQFHLWLSYINDLPGFEEKNMKNFRDFWNSDPDSSDMSYFSVDDLLSLKDIIAREMEALNFVTEIAREFVGQKSSVGKLREGKSVSL